MTIIVSATNSISSEGFSESLDENVNILILRSGTLGDTLVSLPALWSLRNAYPKAYIKYICETMPDQSYTEAPEVLGGTGLVDSIDKFENYTLLKRRILSRWLLFLKLRKQKWDLAISLAEPFWSAKKKHFAKLCGSKRVIGPVGKGVRYPRGANGKLIRVPHIADTLVRVLEPLSIDLPEAQQGRFNLPTSPADERDVSQWLEGTGAAKIQKPWIALGPWSKMPAKRWPIERFEIIVQTLIREWGVTPFIFGAANERPIAESLRNRLGYGYVICGELSFRAVVKLMSLCAFYLGNDTGTMHMAASAGIPCVAIFSSRDSPGRWEPYGNGHVVFRKWVSCEGCMLVECVAERMRCIRSITVEEVIDACRYLLATRKYENKVP